MYQASHRAADEKRQSWSRTSVKLYANGNDTVTAPCLAAPQLLTLADSDLQLGVSRRRRSGSRSKPNLVSQSLKTRQAFAEWKQGFNHVQLYLQLEVMVQSAFS